MKLNRISLVLVVFMIASLACSLFGGGGTGGSGGGDNPSGNESPKSEESTSAPGGSGNFDTEYPLPDDVKNFTKQGEDSINYQTSLKLPEVVDFYRNAFESAGYDERDITTVINDTTFSIVWDGHPSGKALVVQGVDLGDGTVNVNVRLEDV
jgi:hypothetical protein